MKKLTLALLFLPTLAMANTQPTSADEISAKDKLLDKGIITTKVVKDGDCFKFYTDTSRGRVCGDKVNFY